ncbi:MAG: rod shape-determining protein MreD, partial [Acidobacteriota bacterium]
CLLGAAFMQTTLVRLVPEWLGQWLGHVDWLLLVTVYAGLQRNPVRAMLTGMAAGIIYDSLTGANMAGVSGFSYILAAYVTHSITALIIVDNLLVRFIAVTASTLINTSVRLIFYALLKLTFPALAGGKRVAAIFIFALLAHLIASTLLYIVMDRIFLRGDNLRRRREEARRRRV